MKTNLPQLTALVVFLALVSMGDRPATAAEATSAAASYLVPAGLLPEDRFPVIHDYGESHLVAISDPASLPAAVRSRLTPLEERSSVSYHAWRGPAEVKDVGTGSGYYVVTLIGPVDRAWASEAEAAGLKVVATATPYGLVVSGDAKGLAAIETLKTSGGAAVVRGYFPVPPAASLHPELRLVAGGVKSFDAIRGIRRSSDGRAAVRVVPYRDRDVPRFYAAVTRIAAPAGAVGFSYLDAFLVTPAALRALVENVEGIDFIDIVHERTRFNNLAPKDRSGSVAGSPSIMNVTPVWALGWTGAGISVNHNDSGVNPHADFPNYDASPTPPVGSVITKTYGKMTGTDNAHGTHTAGSVIGRGLASSSPSNTSGCGDMDPPLTTVRGTGHGATMTANNLFDGGHTTELAMMQWGYQNGSRLSTNSWGYGSIFGPSTTYGQPSIDVDTAVRDADGSTAGNQEFLLIFAAGNDGSGSNTVSQPGLAKNVLTVGASQNDRCGSYIPAYDTGPNINAIVDFSSRGPSTGRIKPDIAAPGTDVISTESTDASATHSWDQAWTGAYYELNSGTSMATPLLAGAAAVWMEFYQTTYGALPSPALSKAALINGAVDMGYGYQTNTPTGTAAQNSQGWGRSNLLRTIQGPPGVPSGSGIRYVDQSAITPLATGASWSRTFNVGSNTVPLKITLVWTDPPGASSCNPCDINDLDLIVTAPDGTIYRGNQFTSNWSTPNPGASKDPYNNVENVFVQAPVTGQWTLEVVSAETATNPPGLAGQDFAVVYSGYLCAAVPAPSSASAAANGDNRIDVSWSSVTEAVLYRIYRSRTSGSGYEEIATTTSTSYSDLTVLGGNTYYYVIVAEDSVGCPSGYSPEASALATGLCDAAPTFDGLTSATTNGCAIDLSWSAATSNCNATVSYAIYRDTSSTFTPSGSNRIALGVTGTTYSDTSGLVGGTTYYYIVRAVDDGNDAEDTNLVRQSAAAASESLSQGTWNAGAESGDPAFTYSGTWTTSTSRVRSGTNSYFSGYANSTCSMLTTPSLQLAAGYSSTLTFYTAYDIQSAKDGGTVEISVNGGAWTKLTLTPAYPGTIDPAGGSNDNACGYGNGAAVFNGTNLTFTQYTADLSAHNGNPVQIRWSFSTNSNTTAEGWYIDDIVVTNVGTASPCNTLPEAVNQLTARASSDTAVAAPNGSVKLEWSTAPSSSVELRWSTTAVPTTPTEGSLLATVTADATGYGSYTHNGLTIGSSYHYSAFVKNGSSYSERKSVTAVPVDAAGAIKWTYKTSAAALSPPTLNSAVYSPSNDRYLHSVNLTTGGGDWPRTSPKQWTPHAMNAPSQARTPVLDVSTYPIGGANRVVFMTSQDGRVYCVNADTGTEIWASVVLGDMLQAAPSGIFRQYGSILPLDLIIVGTRNSLSANRLVALDAANGSEVWSFDNGGFADAAKAIGVINGGVMIDTVAQRLWFTSRQKAGGSTHTLWCVDFTASAATYRFSAAAGDIDGAPIARTGIVYVGNNDGIVRAYSGSATGVASPIWSYATLDGPVKTLVLPEWGTTYLFFSTTNQVWAITDDGIGSSLVWSTPASGAGSIPSPTRPLKVGETIYAGGSDGNIHVITNIRTATPTVTTKPVATGVVVGSPMMDFQNNLIHVGTEEGIIYAVQP